MYRKADRNQHALDDFQLPFGGKLDAGNRWAKLSEQMPWELIEDLYASTFKTENPDGRIPLSSRIAFGAIFIKEHENFTDEQTVTNITENPYMQYFLGQKGFSVKPLFEASMMVHFRKRFTAEMIAQINEEMYKRMNPPKPPEDKGNNGTLVLDATVAPADIRFPTDESLLNESRENTEKMIDKLWETGEHKGHKTAYNRKKARQRHLSVAKQRKPRRKTITKAIRLQLEYVEKNLETIERLLNEGSEPLLKHDSERLETIKKVALQQRQMIDKKTKSCENRIVSLRQPHI